ncbi:MAG: anhydro-N-acetylmuramic acid kinase [Burkholderiales bacterium]|jgi:anhydro-N-acetylmuramic acid kinase|nr:anhydro-N-acetylmuramic acid kinase [Burkholderiales bacterium]
MAQYYIGLMSGTSLDGVDGVLVAFAPEDDRRLGVLTHSHLPFDEMLRATLLELNRDGANELHRAALAANALARLYATCVEALLLGSGLDRSQVKAIGAHGQTVRHRPCEFDGTGYSIQLMAPALLAESTRIDVVCDFRSRDVAAGGQGAPLVPAFHRAMFGRLAPTLTVLNVGGISNLTVLDSNQVRAGFDCGPGNALMDYWCQRNTGQCFDNQGAWARTGVALPGLVESMLRDPYFSRLAPKSTGRDLFNPGWLDSQLREFGIPLEPKEIQASLVELTALACARDVLHHAPQAQLLLVCGGGALNTYLMERLAAHLPAVAVASTDAHGLPATQVEACAFAWLAHAFVKRQTASLPLVTGAREARVLGALYPAQ